MPNSINQLANVISRECEDYDLNFLVIEIDGVKWSKTRIDSVKQVEKHINQVFAELNIQGYIVFVEDEAIEFSWYLQDQQGKEVNLYMI